MPCCAASSPVFSFCVSLPPPSPLFTPCVCETCVCNGKEDEQTCVIQKHVEKGVQKEKQKTACGVNTLSSTLVPTTPTHPSLHSSRHKFCFPLAVTLTLSFSAPFWLDDKRRMVCMMSNKHTKVALLFLCQPSFSNHLFLVASPHYCCCVVMSVACPIHAANEIK